MANLSILSLSHTTGVDVTEDFELPEYQPEVRRIVGVQCTVTRDHGFLEERTIALSGCVLYTVVYLTTDGALASLPLFSTWDANLPLPESTSIAMDDLHLVCESENVVCRVTAPRKLTLSTRVKLTCLALGTEDCTTDSGTDTGHGNTVHRSEDVPLVHMKTCQGTGTIQGETGGGKVITCQGNVQITEVRTDADGVVVDGEASVRFLVRGDSGAYVPVRSRMPIHATLPCKQAATMSSVTANGICAALTVTEEDDRIRWEMEYDLEAILCGETSAAITTDGYCTTHAYTPHFRTVQAMTGGRCVRGQVTLTGQQSMTNVDGAKELQFLYGWGKGRWEKAEVVGEKLILTGSALCTVLLTGNGDVVTEEVTLPIRYEYDRYEHDRYEHDRYEHDRYEHDRYECDHRSSGADGLTCLMRFSIWDVGGHMEGDTLHIHAEAGCDGILLHGTDLTYLVSLEETMPLPPSKPSVTLYTPAPAETLWDVQKRYHTTDVAEAGERYVIRT